MDTFALLYQEEQEILIDPDSCKKPNVVVIAEQLSLFPQEYYEKGIPVVTVATRRNRPDVLSLK